ncbi:MAG TPA: hypothetical protein VMZ28_30665 [Kofleriaceae bacterium]|nr:hypothetical protein [Kofleriaceae bacterium]
MRLVVAMTIVLALAAPAAAQSQKQELEARIEEGFRLFQDLEYRAAIQKLKPVRLDPAATRAQKLRVLELIGISHLILGEKARATEAFEDLLTLDAGYQLRHDEDSPKIRQFYDTVKAAFLPGFEAGQEARLDHAAPRDAQAGRAVEIEAVVRVGLERVKEVVLRWRRGGVLDYTDAPMRRAGGEGTRWRARFVPPASRSAYAVDYYVEAKNAAGGSIGRVGGPETPLSLEVRAGEGDAEAGPWYTRWYVIGGAAAVIGVAAAAVVLTRGEDAPDGSLDPGRVSLSF